MGTYQWLCLFGVPTVLSSIVGIFVGQIKKVKEDSNALKSGIQALLRAQMIRDWNKYSDLGYAPIYAKENFENCWIQYHSLAANGVMDSIHEKFLALPDDPKE